MKSSEMKKATKRILAMLLCTSMVLSSGVSASADEGMAAAQEQGHVHTEACYEKQNTGNLICTKAEVMEGHVHGDECYETTPKLTCEQEEHSHDDGCYTTETKDVCNDESEEHTCGDACVETEEVLTCTAEEHSHNDGCYETETNLICGQEEVEAHIHNDECYAWEEKLVCTLSETAPMAEEAVAQETVTEQPKEDKKAEEAVEAEEVNLQNDDETGIKVSVKSTSDVLSEDTKVVVAPMEMDEEHETALAEAVSEFEVLGYTAYDISLKDAEDEDITLGENKVEVTIDFEELIPEGINAEEVKDVVLVHITTDEEEKLTAETVGTVEITEEKATVEFEADSFSPYVVTYLSETEEVVEETVIEEPVVEDITLTYTSEDGAYTVTVTGTPEVLENVTAFEAVPVTDEEKITALTEQLTAKAAEAQKTSLGFENYEFRFLDAEGNEAAVNGEVKVSLSFAEERIPEAATAENVDAVDAALLKTGTDDKGEAVLEEINGLVSAEAGAVKEVVYTTEAPEEMILAWSGDVYRTLPNYEDDEVVITLAGTEYALQNVVGFNVTPIKEDNEETEEQYAEVAKQLEEKIAEENEAKEEEKAVVGFLAYDITLVDAEGNELEPRAGVRVSMEYKEAAAPEAVAEAEEAEVTIHHFEEDETGEVKQIVDMVAEETIEAGVTTTEKAEVEKAEFVTEGFSVFAITWTYTTGGYIPSKYEVKINIHYVDSNGKELELKNPDFESNFKIEKIEVKYSLEDFEKQTIEGYQHDRTVIDEGEGEELVQGLQIVENENYYWTTYTLQYMDQNGSWKDWVESIHAGNLVEKNIYLIYESKYFINANMVDTEGNTLGPKRVSLLTDIPYKLENLENIAANNKEYGYVSAYVMHSGTKVDVQSVVYKNGTEPETGDYYYTDLFGVEREYDSETDQLYLIYAAPGTIPYKIVDTSGTLLDNNTRNLEIVYGETFQLKKLSYVTIGTGSTEKRYSYSSAYIKKNGDEETKIDVKEITYDNGKFFYTDSEGKKIEIEEGDVLYLQYRLNHKDEPLTTIETVDNNKANIIMKMFNYEINGGNPTSNSNKEGFMNIGGGWENGVIRQNLLQKKLNNGYPVTDDGTSLAPIFGGSGNVIGGSISSARSVNHLFSQEIYDATGYYEYSSFENYAYLDENNFRVYEQIGAPERSEQVGSLNHKLYNRGNFFPYNDIMTDSNKKTGTLTENQVNYYDEDAQVLNLGDYRYHEPLYKVNDPDFYFGMSLKATFLQPKNGLVNWNGKASPMRYEFNGDDDLWVFIDDVLVLDLGGIHVAHRGYIDFSTGVVAWDNSNEGQAPNVTTTLYELFKTAQAYPDVNNKSQFSETELNKYFRDADGDGNLDTFANYSSHQFNMFYMERGDGASDLHVKFNLPTVGEDTVTVRKEIQNYEEGAYSDVEFSFKLLSEDGETSLLTEGTKFELIKANGTKSEGVVEAGGVFKLKHNEEASFSGLTQGTKYYVEEVGVSSEEYDKVDITASGVTDERGNDIADTPANIKSKELEVGTDHYVVFENRCAATNMHYLVIQKLLSSGTVATDTFYTMQVTVAGQPYTGEYKVGSDYDSADSSQPIRAVGGKIYLKAGQVAIIMGYVSTVDGKSPSKQGIPSGTSFKVEEIELDYNVYAKPTYSVVLSNEENDSYDADVPKDSSSGDEYGSGKIKLEKNAKVIVTNALKSSLTVTKEWVSNETPTTPVRVALYRKSDSAMIREIELNTNNNYSVTIAGLSASDYDVKELNPDTEGAVESGGNIVINGDTYKVTYSKPDPNGVVTITNTQLAKIIINKVSASDSTHVLPGATFELKRVTTTNNGTQYELVDTKTTDVNGSITFANLERGQYRIVETKAPEGYLISGGPVDIDLTTGEVTREITVTNEVVYELPSTGGHGIYTTMLSGFSLMLGAAYVWFASRRKESSNN